MFDNLEAKIKDSRVVQAMSTVPRARFLLPEYLHLAAEDIPLPVGCGQTISQPYIVALMSELLEIRPTDRVLEIGTGSGYQAAVLAELAGEVYTVETIAQLAERSRAVLTELEYANIYFRKGNGRNGWPEHAPYQGIIATAAARGLPPALIGQLDEGGRLVLPLGAPGEVQWLWRFTRRGPDLLPENFGAVRFVPLVGGKQE
jgi:protein-L-isoaspartate(D-aspartate) O-methyltransferase